MKAHIVLACAFCAVSRLGAVTATGLSSFEGLEQPVQRYLPAAKTFEPDLVQAITDEGGGVFRMALRYSPGSWDGDRDTGNRDRQRAEVKGLGPHQKIGETFEYGTTWRVDPSFHGATRFCHIFQLKATEGDDGAPLITMSLERDPNRVSVRYWSGKDRESRAAREFRCVPGAWESVRIRVRTSFGAEGEVLVSVNGDPFTGVRGVPVYRSEARDYRPKWGLYRGVIAGMALGDDYVEHRDVSATNLAGPAIDNAALETAGRARAGPSAAPALAWLETQPASPGRTEAVGAIGAFWAESDPAAAMAWAFAQADRAGREQTLLRIYDRWQWREPNPAVTWLLAHAPNPDLDALLWYQSTDTSFRHACPGLVLARCASLISDPARRLQACDLALTIWARQPGEQQEALRFAREQADLPPAPRAALAERIAALPPTGPRRPAPASGEGGAAQ